MYKIICAKGGIDYLTTVKADGTHVNGRLFANLGDAWDFLQSFQIGISLSMDAKHPAEYTVEELKQPGHLELMIEFTLHCLDGRKYVFILSKEDEFDE